VLASDGIRIVLVGKAVYTRVSAGDWLRKAHGFKVLRTDDGVAKFIRDMYMYQPHKRVTWERRIEFYDAIYKLDNNIHINHLLRKLRSVPDSKSVVVPDARYINEVTALAAQGFLVVRVTDPLGYKPTRMAGMASAAKGTIKLQEFYGRKYNDAYPVDYSVSNDDLTKLRRSIDRIIEKEREKRLVDTEGVVSPIIEVEEDKTST
jgi:hypothetical protein